MIQNKIISSDKDLLGIVFFGTVSVTAIIISYIKSGTVGGNEHTFTYTDCVTLYNVSVLLTVVSLLQNNYFGFLEMFSELLQKLVAN